MSVLDKLRADFMPRAKKLQSSNFELAEGEPLTVYYSPAVNSIQSDKYMPLLAEGKIEGYVMLLITRAKNEDGSPMFPPKDKNTLMRDVDPNLIVEIGNKILGVDADYAPQAAKESEEIAKK